MIVKRYKAKIEAIENAIDGVYTLTFSTEGKKFKYFPGQFLHLAIDSEYDGSSQWPDSRCFSIQTSPEEEYLKITYAVIGGFTKKMEKFFKVGTEVWLKLPYGELFELEHNKTNTVFISGGTGITPFLSLFNDASFANYEKPKLYAGYKRENCNIYHNELEKALKINSGFKIYNIYEDIEGILDIDLIFNENGNTSSYFISGPPTMIRIFKLALLNHGVEKSMILTDDWE